jgi:hypothetical protein
VDAAQRALGRDALRLAQGRAVYCGTNQGPSFSTIDGALYEHRTGGAANDLIGDAA